jgi:hypothetical protein
MSSLKELFDRQQPGPWQKFWPQPCIFLAWKLDSWHKPIPATPLSNPIAIVCISDTHSAQIKIPAGDLTQSGSFLDLQAAPTWLRAQTHPIKIVIAGNHKLLLDSAWDAHQVEGILVGAHSTGLG